MEKLENEIVLYISMIHKEDEKTRNEILSFYNQNLANISFFWHKSSINSTQMNVNCEGKILKLSL